MYASRDLLDEAGVMIKSVEEPEQQIEEFRRFLEAVSPEDFSSGSPPVPTIRSPVRPLPETNA